MFLYFVTEAVELQFFQAKRYDNSTLSWLTLRTFTTPFDCCYSSYLYFYHLYLRFLHFGCQVNGCDSSTQDWKDVVRSVGTDQKKYLYWLHLQNLYLIHLFVVFAFRVSGVCV